jgi:hypothetical protein
MKRKLLLTLTVLAMLVIALVCLIPHGAGKLKAYYIFNNPCESCREYETFLEHFKSTLGKEAANCDVSRVSLLTEDGRKQFADLCAQVGIPQTDRIAPMLIIGKQYLIGMDAIEANSRALYDAVKSGRRLAVPSTPREPSQPEAGQTAQAAGSSDSYLLYFTTELCGACKQTATFLATLPRTVDAADGGDTVASGIVLDTRSTANKGNMDLLTHLYDKWGVPEDKRTVPVVFFRTGYLLGSDAIRSSLLDQLKAGNALHYEGPK